MNSRVGSYPSPCSFSSAVHCIWHVLFTAASPARGPRALVFVIVQFPSGVSHIWHVFFTVVSATFVCAHAFVCLPPPAFTFVPSPTSLTQRAVHGRRSCVAPSSRRSRTRCAFVRLCVRHVLASLMFAFLLSFPLRSRRLYTRVRSRVLWTHFALPPSVSVVSFIPHAHGSSVHHSSAAPFIWHVSGSFVSHHVHSVRAPRVLFTAFRLLSRRIVFSCAALPCVACVSEILPHTVRK